MAITLTKPAAGSSGWADAMNINLAAIETAINQILEPLATNAGAISTNANAISTNAGAISTNYSAISNMANQMTAIQNSIADILAIITVNTSSVTISARVQEIPGYISISASISPSTVSPRFWRAIVSKKEGTGTTATVVEVLTVDFTSSRQTIPFDILSGVDVGDVLYVKVYAYFSDTSFVESNEQSLTYQGYEGPIVERMKTLEEGLTLDNIVNAVKNSSDILTLLSNSLQNSTTLARKVAEETL